MRVHPFRFLSKEARELAAVRGQYGRCSAVERLQLEEGVRIHDGGKLGLLEQAPHERLLVATEPGA